MPAKGKAGALYRYSVEVSVNLHPDKTGDGSCTQLYIEILKRLTELGYHAVTVGFSLPNPSSIALHEKFGMAKVAHLKEVGFKFGKWVDGGYWLGLLKSPTETP